MYCSEFLATPGRFCVHLHTHHFIPTMFIEQPADCSDRQQCGCILTHVVLLGMQCSSPRMVPVHNSAAAQWGPFAEEDWVSLSLTVNKTHFVAEGEETEQYRIVSVLQRKVGEEYRNTLLSKDGWEWRGNVVVAHACGMNRGRVMKWVQTHMDTVRNLLAEKQM